MKYTILPLLFLVLAGASCQPEQVTFDNSSTNDRTMNQNSQEIEPLVEVKNGTEDAEEPTSDKVGQIITVEKPSGLPDARVETGSTSKEGPIAVITTTFGTIKIQLFEEATPATVKNFISLAEAGFYDGTIFHRIISDFMIQGGDPLTREQRENWSVHGTGGPGYAFGDEISRHGHTRGVISMANSGPNTNGSQFFIVTGEANHLNGRHAVFGEVIQGMGVVDRIESLEVDRRNHPQMDLEIISVEIQR